MTLSRPPRRFTIGTNATVYHGIKDGVANRYLTKINPTVNVRLSYDIHVRSMTAAYTQAAISCGIKSHPAAFAFLGGETSASAESDFADNLACVRLPISYVSAGSMRTPVQPRQLIWAEVTISANGGNRHADDTLALEIE